MDYKEKYGQALEVAKETYNTQPMYREWLEKMFPEFKESEDEKIREALIRFHKSTIDIDGIKGADIISWLEKQGKCKIDCHRNHQDANYPKMIMTTDEIWKKAAIAALPECIRVVNEVLKMGGKLTEKTPADQAAVMAWQYADAFVKELGK